MERNEIVRQDRETPTKDQRVTYHEHYTDQCNRKTVCRTYLAVFGNGQARLCGPMPVVCDIQRHFVSFAHGLPMGGVAGEQTALWRGRQTHQLAGGLSPFSKMEQKWLFGALVEALHPGDCERVGVVGFELGW